VPTPRPIRLGRLDDASALGQLQARSLKLFLLGTRAAELAPDNAGLLANELAVTGIDPSGDPTLSPDVP